MGYSVGDIFYISESIRGTKFVEGSFWEITVVNVSFDVYTMCEVHPKRLKLVGSGASIAGYKIFEKINSKDIIYVGKDKESIVEKSNNVDIEW